MAERWLATGRRIGRGAFEPEDVRNHFRFPSGCAIAGRTGPGSRSRAPAPVWRQGRLSCTHHSTRISFRMRSVLHTADSRVWSAIALVMAGDGAGDRFGGSRVVNHARTRRALCRDSDCELGTDPRHRNGDGAVTGGPRPASSRGGGRSAPAASASQVVRTPSSRGRSGRRTTPL